MKPLERLKIDQSFVQDVMVDPNDAVIVKTIIALAHSLDVAVIAEGVETMEQRTFLASHGCNAYQGYLFGRPVPIEEICQTIQLTRPGLPVQATATGLASERSDDGEAVTDRDIAA